MRINIKQQANFLFFYELIEMLQRKLYKTEIILEIDVCCESV